MNCHESSKDGKLTCSSTGDRKSSYRPKMVWNRKSGIQRILINVVLYSLLVLIIFISLSSYAGFFLHVPLAVKGWLEAQSWSFAVILFARLCLCRLQFCNTLRSFSIRFSEMTYDFTRAHEFSDDVAEEAARTKMATISRTSSFDSINQVNRVDIITM